MKKTFRISVPQGGIFVAWPNGSVRTHRRNPNVEITINGRPRGEKWQFLPDPLERLVVQPRQPVQAPSGTVVVSIPVHLSGKLTVRFGTPRVTFV